MNLYPTRAAAIEHEIRKPLAEGIEDLLSDPLPDGDGRTFPTVEDYYDVDAIAAETLELFVLEGRGVYYGLQPDISPILFQDITERHALPAD